MTTNIPVNRLPENHTPFFVKISSGATVRIETVTLVSRSFDGPLSSMTDKDSVVLSLPNNEELVAVKHARNPSLVLQVTDLVETTNEDGEVVMSEVPRPSSKRVTFMEIDDESKKMKEIADQVAKAAEEEAVAAEIRRTLSAKLTGDRAPRASNGTKSSTVDLIERLKSKVTTFAKRQATLAEDTRKNDEKLDANIASLAEHGITVEITDGIPTFITAEPSPEQEVTAGEEITISSEEVGNLDQVA